MSADFDFRTLDDKEFEILCADAVGAHLSVRIERFRPGRDSGVDGRFFSSKNEEVVLQCKHWINTPVKTLISRLESDELPKIRKLKPARYLLAVSSPLTRHNKDELVSRFCGFITSPSDIFGSEDINDVLRENSHLVERHYKLWLQSAAVLRAVYNHAILERSRSVLREIQEKSDRYVTTSSHKQAAEKLQKNRIVIVTGEPGIGKTTLAEQLCLSCAAEGFELQVIAEEITEAEGVIFDERKQVFYFDDFLGTNYLEALTGHEGSHIVRFIKRIRRSENKRFILTSRSTILNQGKALIDKLRHENIERDEFEISIKALTPFEKARILYSHIWRSALTQEYIEAIYRDKRYRKIIDHNNFNPRLISFITDASRASVASPEKYWEWIGQALDNPSEIWENPFTAQHDDYGRVLVLLVATNGTSILEEHLAEAYERYIATTPGFSGRRDFLYQLKHLAGSMLSRSLYGERVAIGLFNPSIGDFILHRYRADKTPLLRAIAALRTNSSLDRFSDLRQLGVFDKSERRQCCVLMFDAAVHTRFQGYEREYLARLLQAVIETPVDIATKGRLSAFCAFVDSEGIPSMFKHTAQRFLDAYRNKAIDEQALYHFVLNALDCQPLGEKLEILGESIAELDNVDIDVTTIAENLRERILEKVSDNLESEIDESTVFNVKYGDTKQARKNLRNEVEALLDKYCLPFDDDEVDVVLNNYDLEARMERYFDDDDSAGSSYQRPRYLMAEQDEIDDLFDRS